jgi:hypothetical protein
MGFLRRLWHRLLFGPSPLTQPPRPAARPDSARLDDAAAARAAAAKAHQAACAATRAALDAWVARVRQFQQPRPPRCVYRSREERELALLLAWLPDAERRRFLDLLLPKAAKYHPWTPKNVEGEPWQQCQKWADPLVINEPETMTSEGFCALLETQLAGGLITFCTPLDLLSRPVRMLWLLRQGQHAKQVYTVMEQVLGRAQAMDFAWWVVTGL